MSLSISSTAFTHFVINKARQLFEEQLVSQVLPQRLATAVDGQ